MPADGTAEGIDFLPAAPPPPAVAAAKPTTPEGNIKDTVESILVAFILAFVFRAFVVEAFVIPTGSMAPTLMGAHMKFRCEDCGYSYAVNYPTRQVGNDLYIPPRSGPIQVTVRCPNCGFAPHGAGAGEDARDNVPVNYGDRILVLKYRYLVSEPQRWDVVVFKAPVPVEPAPLYTTNYIKRLIGRPGESVMLLDGDVYVSTAAPPPPGTEAESPAFEKFLQTFQVQRKPGYAQDALWRNVYDNDHLPHLPADQRSKPWQQPWKQVDGGKGWDVGQNLPGPEAGRTRAFRFADANGSATLKFDPTANPDAFPMTDFVAYDQYGGGTENPEIRRGEHNAATDLKLACSYKRESGDGPLKLQLSKRGVLWSAEVTPGRATLVRLDEATGAVVKRYDPVDVPALAKPGVVRLEFANADYRVSLKVDGKEVLATPDADYAPTGPDILAIDREEAAHERRPGTPSSVRLSAERQACALEHVSLARDVFYINARNPGAISVAGLSGMRASPSPESIITLGPDEFFVCGDNALISGDARTWTNVVNLPHEGLPALEPARVPRQFLLGKAFFVYWPAGHRIPSSDWGIIPNFGDMRFIH